MPSIPALERLLASSPSDPFLLYGLAQEYAKVADHPRAIEYYDRCLAADPAYCYAYYHKARSLEVLGRTPDALKTLEQGLAAARSAGDAHALSEISGYRDMLSP